MRSKDYGPYIRITWKEQWKDDHAIIYDYTKTHNPICFIPIQELFNIDFVREKRQQPSYENSGYWWTQKFPLDKALAQFVLSYRDRWDLL